MITSALIVAAPYADLIIDGRKTWELRSGHCRKREQIGIIAHTTGCIVGVVTVIGRQGPMTNNHLVNTQHLHQAPCSLLEQHPAWTYAWHLEAPAKLSVPVPYHHPYGAQSWVKIGLATALRVAYQTDGEVRRRMSPLEVMHDCSRTIARSISGAM